MQRQAKKPSAPLVDCFAEGRYTKKKKLGAGGYGEVYLVQCSPRDEDGVVTRDISLEAKIQMDLDHPNITKCLDARFSPDGNKLQMFMEVAPQGSLDKILRIRHMHEQGYAHRDIKPANILVFNTHQVKITDFGVAQRTYGCGMVATQGGTPFYKPPEILNLFGVTSCTVTDGIEWDLWSAALVYLHMLIGKKPWKQSHTSDPEFAAFQLGHLRTLMEIDRRWERARKDFYYIRKFLRSDPTQRIQPMFS